MTLFGVSGRCSAFHIKLGIFLLENGQSQITNVQINWVHREAFMNCLWIEPDQQGQGVFVKWESKTQTRPENTFNSHIGRQLKDNIGHQYIVLIISVLIVSVLYLFLFLSPQRDLAFLLHSVSWHGSRWLWLSSQQVCQASCGDDRSNLQSHMAGCAPYIKSRRNSRNTWTHEHWPQLLH